MIVSAGGPENEKGKIKTAGIDGSKLLLEVLWPDKLAGSAGKGGISGVAGMGTLLAGGSTTSCNVRSGILGVSGVVGNGRSGVTADKLSVPGKSGLFTSGAVMLIAGRSGAEAIDTGWIVGATSAIAKITVPVVPGLPSVVPLVIVPGVVGGGTFQSD